MSTTITDTRKESADAERKVEDRRNATHQISNLKRSNEAKHLALAESGSPSREDVQIGDADAGLAVDLSKLPDLSETNQLSSEQELYLDSLPPVAVLEARLRAYEILNDSAEENLGQLKRQSVTIEKKLCKIVALCTNLDERKVHTMAENLAAAVASDAGDEVDTGRLRDFLRKVENGEI